MQPGSKKLVRFLQTWVIDSFAVMVAVIILRNHISYGDSWKNLLLATFVLGILNAFVRPILRLIALPLLILTLGLFTFVINALLLCFLSVLLPFFHVDRFMYAFLGAIIISVISAFLNLITGNARISIKKGGPQNPPKTPGAGGNGPVIDV
jgi:putative membrane protein